jgi:hypothetical protein
MTPIIKQTEVNYGMCILEYGAHVINQKRSATHIKILPMYTYDDIEHVIIHIAFHTSYKYFKLTEEETIEHYLLETI